MKNYTWRRLLLGEIFFWASKRPFAWHNAPLQEQTPPGPEVHTG